MKKLNPVNIGFTVRMSSRIDKLNFECPLAVNMYLNMLMLACT